MAKPEQTEKATPKRREEARKRGQVPRSQDLAGAAIFLACVFVVHAFLKVTVNGLEASTTSVFERIVWMLHRLALIDADHAVESAKENPVLQTASPERVRT